MNHTFFTNLAKTQDNINISSIVKNKSSDRLPIFALEVAQGAKYKLTLGANPGRKTSEIVDSGIDLRNAVQEITLGWAQVKIA